MSDGLQSCNKPSFYARHLHLSGIEKHESVSDADLKTDQVALSAIELPELHLLSDPSELRTHEGRSNGSFMQWIRSLIDKLLVGHAGLIGAGVMVFLVLLPMATMQRGQEPLLGFRVKGGDKVSLFRERQGSVSLFTVGSKLENGDRLRTEVMVAGADRLVFQFVSNGDHRVLSSLSDILQDQLALSAGDPGVFPGSIELVGANEGETLNILICSKAVGAWQVAEFVKEYPVNGGKIAPKGCILKAYELR